MLWPAGGLLVARVSIGWSNIIIRRVIMPSRGCLLVGRGEAIIIREQMDHDIFCGSLSMARLPIGRTLWLLEDEKAFPLRRWGPICRPVPDGWTMLFPEN